MLYKQTRILQKWCEKINSREVVIGHIGKAGKQDSGHLIRGVGSYNIAVNVYTFIIRDVSWEELEWLNAVNIKYITDLNMFSPIYL